jgi:hypothetical protein
MIQEKAFIPQLEPKTNPLGIFPHFGCSAIVKYFFSIPHMSSFMHTFSPEKARLSQDELGTKIAGLILSS